MQVAYVPQSAFIYNASVRDNILFGLPFDQERYDQAIAAAAVRPDLDNMQGMMLLSLYLHSVLHNLLIAICSPASSRKTPCYCAVKFQML